MLGDLARGEADGVRVERPGEAAVGGEQHDAGACRPRAAASSGWSSPPSTAARSARTSSSFSLYGRAASVASWARLSFDAATNCIARVICLMFRTEPMRRRISRWLATSGRTSAVRPGPAQADGRSAVNAVDVASSSAGLTSSSVSALGLAELGQDRPGARSRGSGRTAVSNSLTRGVGTSSSLPLVDDVQDRDLLLDRQRLVLRLLDDLGQLLAAGQLVAGGLVEVRRELRERGQRAVLGEVQLERRRRPSSSPWSAPPSRRARPRCRCSARAAGRR